MKTLYLSLSAVIGVLFLIVSIQNIGKSESVGFLFSNLSFFGFFWIFALLGVGLGVFLTLYIHNFLQEKRRH